MPGTRADQTHAPTHRSSWDLTIASLADRQHGVVARGQLIAEGITSAGIRHRLARGRLHAVHPGIYAVGLSRPSPRGSWMAAVLGGGAGALLSHRAAASLWGILDGVPAAADVVVLRTGTSRAGVRPHRVRRVPAADRAEVDGIPCTSVERTILDLAPVVAARRVDRMLRRADELRVLDVGGLEAQLTRGRAGTPALRAALGAVRRDAEAEVRTKSELELRFRELLRVHGLAVPRMNVAVDTPWATYEVDALWRPQHLVVELDGWQTHRDRETFRRDHRRGADLAAVGYRVVRLSWEQVVDDPQATASRLRRLVPSVDP